MIRRIVAAVALAIVAFGAGFILATSIEWED